MWGGWQSNATPLSKLCYRLSKMTNQYMLAGSIVHNSIEWYLKLARMGHLTTLDDLHEAATNNARRAWRQSLKKQWKNNPKNACNLFEHYYDREIDTERMQATIMDCLHNFYTYALPMIISCKDGWKALEEFQSFDTGNYTIALSMDFAYELDGRLHIIDWKSGKPGEAATKQLMVYALYASSYWDYTAEDIQTSAYYLRTNDVESVIPAQKSLDECLERITKQVETMAAYLRGYTGGLELNEPLTPDKFPRTEDVWKCDGCFYREVCHGK